jgi:phosphinothricin acetyltransferase
MIRTAVRDDIPQLRDIYNEAILSTTATFDTEIKDMENRSVWFAEHENSPYVILVDEKEYSGEVQGYASLSQYRERKAFDSTVEISVYIAEKYRGRGIGKALMQEAIRLAQDNPAIHTVVSLIEGSNAASIHLHESLGFSFCGKFRQVGYKFDRWLDLSMYQLDVDGQALSPFEPSACAARKNKTV